MSNTTVLQAGQSLVEIGTNGGNNDIARGNIRTPILRSCKVAATSNVTSLSGTATIDGVALVANDPVLLTAQTTATQNGPWVVQAGAWVRPGDYASTLGAFTHARSCLVWAGSTSANKGLWTLSTVPTTVDTTATTWTAPPTGGGGGGTEYQTWAVGGSAQTQRPTGNFIAATGITITPADNSGSNRTDFTFAVTGGGTSSPTPQPSDQNLIAWAADPGMVPSSNQLTPVAGTIYLIKMPVRTSVTFAKTMVEVPQAGSGATSLANCFMGLYIVSGSNFQLIGSTPDQSTNWASGIINPKTDILTVQGGQSLTQAVSVWGAVLVGQQATTPVKLSQMAAGFGNAGAFNAGLTAGTDFLRGASYNTGGPYTALPATIPVASLVASLSLWMAAL